MGIILSVVCAILPLVFTASTIITNRKFNSVIYGKKYFNKFKFNNSTINQNLSEFKVDERNSRIIIYAYYISMVTSIILLAFSVHLIFVLIAVLLGSLPQFILKKPNFYHTDIKEDISKYEDIEIDYYRSNGELTYPTKNFTTRLKMIDDLHGRNLVSNGLDFLVGETVDKDTLKNIFSMRNSLTEIGNVLHNNKSKLDFPPNDDTIKYLYNLKNIPSILYITKDCNSTLYLKLLKLYGTYEVEIIKLLKLLDDNKSSEENSNQIINTLYSVSTKIVSEIKTTTNLSLDDLLTLNEQDVFNYGMKHDNSNYKENKNHRSNVGNVGLNEELQNIEKSVNSKLAK